jgi:hypothetical protein
LDLTSRLQKLEGVGPLWVLAHERADEEALTSLGARMVRPKGEPFHFGRALADFAEQHGGRTMGYFGGASAPLVGSATLAEAFDRVRRVRKPTAVVNNYYSTDWAVISHGSSLSSLAEKLATDNPLGWVLGHDAGYRVHALPISAGTQADIDTPSDALLMAGHPNLGPEMGAFLARSPEADRQRVEAVRRVLRTPAKTLAIIGRASAQAWQELERRTQIWVRLFVEERGMLASGRAQRGEVRSLIGQMVDDWGPAGFIERLAGMADAALWDTRVWLAHRQKWPPQAERFAADLGWAQAVAEPGLRELTQAVASAPIPIITGGHSVVSGSLLALLETTPEG